MALFNIGDLTLSLYESELATGLLPNKITDLSSLSNSGEARSPILNRACSLTISLSGRSAWNREQNASKVRDRETGQAIRPTRLI